jgi:hypothetical protein
MPEPLPPESSASSGVRASLHVIAEILRDPHPISHEVREVLAAFVDELGETLTSSTAPPAEVAHLADSAVQLVRAVNRKEAPGILASARDRLDAAILAAQTKNPLTAGLVRRLLDALADIGI